MSAARAARTITSFTLYALDLAHVTADAPLTCRRS